MTNRHYPGKPYPFDTETESLMKNTDINSDYFELLKQVTLEAVLGVDLDKNKQLNCMDDTDLALRKYRADMISLKLKCSVL